MSDSRSAYDEQLPWLEAVDDEDGPRGVPARRMLAALLVVLLAVALVSATFFWLGRRNGGDSGGAPELIKAEPKPAETAKPEAKVEEKPEPAPSGGKGSVIQLGAFANQAQAERAWAALSARFPGVAALNRMIVPFPGGIRLRAGAGSPAEAKQVCDTVKAAGENCFVAQ